MLPDWLPPQASRFLLLVSGRQPRARNASDMRPLYERDLSRQGLLNVSQLGLTLKNLPRVTPLQILRDPSLAA